MSRGLWTEDETARLMDLFRAGHSFTQIGRILDRPRNSCIGRYHRHMVKMGHVPIKRTPDDNKPELMRNTTPKRQYRPSVPAPELPKAGVGFVMPMLAIVPAQKGPAIGILDVTGCRWPLEDDPAVIGGRSFCNAPQKSGRSYCAAHCRASKSTEPVKTWLKAVAA